MSDNLRPADESVPAAKPDEPMGYQAPRIESSMTAGELEREVLYAGQPITDR